MLLYQLFTPPPMKLSQGGVTKKQKWLLAKAKYTLEMGGFPLTRYSLCEQHSGCFLVIWCRFNILFIVIWIMSYHVILPLIIVSRLQPRICTPSLHTEHISWLLFHSAGENGSILSRRVTLRERMNPFSPAESLCGREWHHSLPQSEHSAGENGVILPRSMITPIPLTIDRMLLHPSKFV